MPKLRLLVDGWSSSNVGFGVINADTRRDGPAREWLNQPVPQTATRVLTAPRPEYEGRSLQVLGTFITDGGSTGFRSNLAELMHRLDSHDAVEVSFSDSTDRVFFARYASREHDHLTKASFSADEVELRFQLLDPFEREATESTLAVSTGGTSVPMGTAPVEDWKARAYGPASDVNFVWRTSTGGEVFRTSFTLSLSSGEHLELDAGTGTIVDQSGASKQDARDSGTPWPWALDPRDGVGQSSNWPTFAIEGASSGELDVRKAWS